MNPNRLDIDVSKRIAVLRYPLIYLIVIVHVPDLNHYLEQPGVESFIFDFVKKGLVRVSISTLTCISGYLIFMFALHENFPLLIRKRAQALILPMIVWNLPLVFLLYFVQAWDLTNFTFNPTGQMYPFNPMQWINGVFAVTDIPIVGPMYFLRDLFLVSFFAPLMGWVIKRAPWVGLAVLLLIFYPDFDGKFILTNTIPISFYVGGMAAVMKWDIQKWDRYAWPLTGILLLICIGMVIIPNDRPEWLRLIAPFFIWPTASLMVGTRVADWFARNGRAAVFLFMFHGFALIFLMRAFPDYQEGDYEFLIWLAVPLLIAWLSQYLFQFLDNHFPGILSLLTGGRKRRVIDSRE
jgi:succinoglycan biosynthesis protein ExoH